MNATTHPAFPQVVREGIYPRFPSIKAYRKRFLLGPTEWESGDLVRLQRYITEPHFSFSYGSDAHESTEHRYGFSSAQSDLRRVAIGRAWQAIQAALGDQPGWLDTWRQAVAYDHWAQRMDIRFHEHALAQYRAGQRSQLLASLFLEQIGVAVGNCLSLGWIDWANELTQRSNAALRCDAFDEFGHRGIFNDALDGFGRRRTQHFVLRLVDDWNGWPPAQEPADCKCAFDLPLFNALIRHWRTDDLDALRFLLLAACDRHTQQSRVDAHSRGTFYDLTWDGVTYNPFEILSVLRLRELSGLAQPTLPHPLLQTPLGRLSPLTPIYTDAPLEGVLTQAQRELGPF